MLKRKKIIIVGLLIFCMVTFSLANASIQSTSDSFTGYAEIVEAKSFLLVQEKVVREHAPITLEAHNLLIDTNYLINWTTDDYGLPFIASEMDYDKFVVAIDAPYQKNQSVTFYLRLNETKEILDSITLKYVRASDVSIESFFDNIPSIAVFSVVVSAILAIPILVLFKK